MQTPTILKRLKEEESLQVNALATSAGYVNVVSKLDLVILKKYIYHRKLYLKRYV